MNAKHKTHEENKTRHITIYLLKIIEKVEMLRAARGKKSPSEEQRIRMTAKSSQTTVPTRASETQL